jgi:hypothetical protein
MSISSNIKQIVRRIILEGRKAPGDSCPRATQDAVLNTKNRNKAIKKLGYGPANPAKPGDFWEEKAEMWDGIPVSAAKSMLCGNCAAFDISPEMLGCIEKGIEGGDARESGSDTIRAGKLGYCHMHHFKCASKRTCDTWVTGGPIKKRKA